MKEIKNLVAEINLLAPQENSQYQIDYNSNYGGYRLVNVNLKNGGHYGAFGESATCSRIKKSEMINKLNLIIFMLRDYKK